MKSIKIFILIILSTLVSLTIICNATDHYSNKALSTAELSGSWRPDAIIFSGGMIYIHEVVSPSQSVSSIINKIAAMKAANPGENIIWSYQTIGGSIMNA